MVDGEEKSGSITLERVLLNSSQILGINNTISSENTLKPVSMLKSIQLEMDAVIIIIITIIIIIITIIIIIIIIFISSSKKLQLEMPCIKTYTPLKSSTTAPWAAAMSHRTLE